MNPRCFTWRRYRSNVGNCWLRRFRRRPRVRGARSCRPKSLNLTIFNLIFHSGLIELKRQGIVVTLTFMKRSLKLLVTQVEGLELSFNPTKVSLGLCQLPFNELTILKQFSTPNLWHPKLFSELFNSRTSFSNNIPNLALRELDLWDAIRRTTAMRA